MLCLRFGGRYQQKEQLQIEHQSRNIMLLFVYVKCVYNLYICDGVGKFFVDFSFICSI